MEARINVLPMKKILGLIIALVAIFGVWLFYWPLMEAFYAWSFDPLFAKIESFVLGIILMIGGAVAGVRVLN
jgi:multidrug resistance efflux pump